MNRRSIALLSLLAAMSCANAQESTPLCGRPARAACVDPQWGMIQPDAALMASRDPSANAQAPIAVRLSTAGDAPVPSKAAVAGAKKYQARSKALTTAIANARFDADGRIVSGAPGIVAAAEQARRSVKGFGLTLYVKDADRLDPAQAALLSKKIDAINALLTPKAGS